MIVTGVSPVLVMIAFYPGGIQASHPHSVIHVQVGEHGCASLKEKINSSY